MEATKENKLLTFNDNRYKLDHISMYLGSLSQTSPTNSNSFLKLSHGFNILYLLSNLFSIP